MMIGPQILPSFRATELRELTMG